MDCNRVGAEPEQHQFNQHDHQHEHAYHEQFNYEGYDQGGGLNGYGVNDNINQTNYGGGVSPFNKDNYTHYIGEFGKGKGKEGKGGTDHDKCER